MLKIFGCLILLFGTIGTADSFYRGIRQNFLNLMEMEEMISFFITEICTCRMTLPEIMQNTSEKIREPFAGFLINVGKTLKKNEEYRFHIIWRECLENSMGRFAFGEEEMDILLNLGRAVEQDQTEMHKDALMMQKELVHRMVAEKGLELKEKRKLCYSLGTMSGLFIIIILF